MTEQHLPDATRPKRFQKKESPFKVTDLWAEVQKLRSVPKHTNLEIISRQRSGRKIRKIWQRAQVKDDSLVTLRTRNKFTSDAVID